MLADFDTLTINVEEGIVFVQLNEWEKSGSVSLVAIKELHEVCRSVQQKPESYQALVLMGLGAPSVDSGDTFISECAEENSAPKCVDETIDLYLALLAIQIPVLSMIDQLLEGLALQLSLLTDWRIASEGCEVKFGGFKDEPFCALESFIIEQSFGRALMQKLCYRSSRISAQQALDYSLLSQLVPASGLQLDTIAAASSLSQRTPSMFAITKKLQNQRLIDLLETARKPIAEACVDVQKTEVTTKTFKAKQLQPIP